VPGSSRHAPAGPGQDDGYRDPDEINPAVLRDALEAGQAERRAAGQAS
jgi:hypothetical protein